MYSKWDNFQLPQLTENNYGINWPKGTVQITKELMCFKQCRMGKRSPGMMPALTHFLNIQRMLFPTKIELYVDVAKGRIWNNYYLDVASKLCDFQHTLLTGPASANKTYGVASFDFTSWICAPHETLVMVSTTSGSASERRIWADIKDFHREAKYEECGIEPIGEVVEYLKAIVYDPGKQLGGSDKNSRDFRNCIQVIPIATDSSGESALATIQGSKNKFVNWTLDEMAQMQEGVTRPNGNLSQNPHYQFIGIGNANDVTDPHGRDCMPYGGIESLNIDADREWTSATGKSVLFLHGDESPNNHPYIDQSTITKVTDYPFPYASNKLSADRTAIEYGYGNKEEGEATSDYWKFCKGFWPPATATSALYTKNLFQEHDALKEGDVLVSGVRTFAAGDFAFSCGGDSNSFYTIKFGFTAQGKKQLVFAKEGISVRSKAKSNKEFIKQTAHSFIDLIAAHGVRFKDFGGDIGNDAALTFNEMSKAGKTHELVGISSVGAAGEPKKYKNKVTELWFKARDLIKTGLCRGINTQSKYYTQLCQRKYNSLGKNFYEIEKKKEMKKRIGRSPDDADAFIYCCWMVIQSGLFDDELAAINEVKTAEEEAEDEAQLKYLNDMDPRFRNRGNEDYSQLTDFSDMMEDYADVY